MAAEDNIQQIPREPDFNNTFSKALRQDRHYAFREKDSYSDSWNGRILYNKNNTFAWVNDDGNELLFSLKTGYTPIGGAEFADKVIILSTDETNSEIGILNINGDGSFGQYITAFNDLYDPNSELLGWSRAHKMNKVIAHKEGILIERIYGTDATTEPFAFNVLVGLQANSPQFINGDYQPLVSTGKYPWFYSVHSIHLQCDFDMGKVKFVQQVSPGSLKTGMVRITYRMVTRDGYKTPWYPVGKPLWITLDPVITNPSTGRATLLDVNGNPSDKVSAMYASNVMTNIGYQFTIEGADTRYYQVEWAYLYSIAQDATVEAAIFERDVIDPTQPNITVNFLNMTGDPVSLDEFNQIIVPIKTCQTLEQKDQILFPMGIETYGAYVVDTSLIKIDPTLKLMTVDNTALSKNTAPLTNSSQANSTPQIQEYVDNTTTPVIENYNIQNDFPNYKGVQWFHLFGSYWREETYPFSLVIFDLKGNPFYAQHIQDFTFPHQYDNNDSYKLMDNTTNAGALNILGALFSSINIPLSIIYDENQKLLVSGFAIMRTERVKRIVAQGILINCVGTTTGNDHSPGFQDDSNNTYALPTLDNQFNGGAMANIPNANWNPNVGITSDTPDTGDATYFNRAYTYTFHSPESYFLGPAMWDGTQQTTVLEDVDQMSIAEIYTIPDGNVIELDGGLAQFYGKFYNYSNPSVLPYPKGAATRLRLEGTTNFGGTPLHPYDPDATQFTFGFGDDVWGLDSCEVAKQCWTDRNSWIIKGKDFTNLTMFTGANHAVFPVVNYKVNQNSYYQNQTGATGLNNRLYQSTGHFQPLNADVIAATTVLQLTISNIVGGFTIGDSVTGATSTATGTIYQNFSDGNIYLVTVTGTFKNGETINNITSGGTAKLVSNQLVCQFNGVEVWGGDCYPWIFDFTRLYPRYHSCDTSAGCFLDYSISMVVPLETSVPIALRRGRSFAGNGTYSENSACNPPGFFVNGVMPDQPEEFNINDVLLFKEDVQFFLPLQPSVNPYVVDFPDRYLGSVLKIDQEIYDQYRQYYPINYGDLQGVYGDIIGSGFLFDQVYVLQEKAFCRLRINERTLFSPATPEAVQTGTGQLFDLPEYISTEHGCRHVNGIVQTDKGLYWPDERQKCLCRFAQDGVHSISDENDMHDFAFNILQYFDNDFINLSTGEYKHIHGVYDSINDEVVWTFLRNIIGDPVQFNQSISYNVKIGGFTSNYNIYPFVYANARAFVLAADPANINKVFIQGKGNKGSYFGVINDSILEFVINAKEDVDKVFDNLFANINVEAVSCLYKIDMITDKYTQTLDVTNDTIGEYRNGIYLTPTMQRNQEQELEGKYLRLRFYFNNTTNQPVQFVSNSQRFRLITKVH